MTAEQGIAALILAANAALVLVVVAQGARGQLSEIPTEPLVTLKERINNERTRAGGLAAHDPGKSKAKAKPPAPLEQHPPKATDGFVLAGMDGFTGEPCEALAALIVHMDEGLVAAGSAPPPVEVDSLLRHSDCSIDDPLVNLSLRKYRRAWNLAGLTPLSPFRFLSKSTRPPQ